MISRLTLALAAAAAGTISASPILPRSNPTTVPLTHISDVKDLKSLIASGQARLNKINNNSAATGSKFASNGAVTNQDVSYIAALEIGGETYNLVVDTGSSNTWVGATKPYRPGPGAQDTGNEFEAGYGSGQVNGEEYLDSVSFAGLTVHHQSIGVATQAQGFKNVDGIFGLGPVTLTKGTVDHTSYVPTFMNNLYKQGSISSEVLGVYFAPEFGSNQHDKNGELTLGGVDESKFTGEISYFPTLKEGLAGKYWGIDVEAFGYGETQLGSTGAGIVDTGTTLIYLPTPAWTDFLAASDGKPDAAAGLPAFTKKPTQNLKWRISGKEFELTPEQYLVPAAQYPDFQLESGKWYAWIQDGGKDGVTAVLGQKFLEHWYSVYDAGNQQIGFAVRKGEEK